MAYLLHPDRMLRFAAMRGCDLRLIPRHVRRLLVLVGLVATLVAPQALVWCRAADGHSAIENAWLGCCTTDDAEAICGTTVTGGSLGGEDPAPGASEDSCSDVWLGASAAVSPAARAVLSLKSPAAFPASGDRAICNSSLRVESLANGLPQALAVIRSTVLTL
jgi:hypothetical protein